MLTLNDGRSELWQWDTGRTLAVDADCSQVHFSNKVFGRSIDVDVVDSTAIIPDILLQTDNDLNVWAFVGTAENGYTKISKTFKINRRNKPADYVFTPTDQITLQTIQNQIGDLADLTTEAKGTLVAAINEAAQSSGGGAGIVIDSTLTQGGQAADAAEVGARLSSLSDEIANLNTGGISATARNLLITILRNGVYSSDQKANITALETALASSGGGSGDGSGGDAETVIYTVTNKLTNVVNSNSSKSVTEGSSYVANLTADEGYSIDSVSVLMGGVDVTAAVYANGVLVINSITGDIVITATAIETIDDNFVWVVGTTESTGKWQTSSGQRLTPYKKNGTFVAFTATDDNMMYGDYRGNLYLATIPEGSTLLTIPEHESTWIIAPAIFSANGTRLADPGYNTATIDLTKYPTAVYYGANLKPSDNAVNESDWSTVNAAITDFVFS